MNQRREDERPRPDGTPVKDDTFSREAPSRQPPLGERTTRRIRLAVIVVAALVAFGLAYLFSAGFRQETDQAFGILAHGDIAALRDYILSFGLWAPVVSMLLMVLQAVAAPLPAFVITFANGLAFGAFWGGLLSVFGATVAATISFYLARALGRSPVEALVGKAGLQTADRWFARWFAYAVLVGRLVPIISFDVISFASGLTRMRFPGFLVATVIGMSPATFVYAYLGWRAPQYVNLLLVVFGVVLAITVVSIIFRRYRKGKPVP